MFLFNPLRVLRPQPLEPVSILVLMDVPLQQVKILGETLLLQCFNPCFNGCSSSTQPGKRKYSNRNVSILVLMDVPLQLCLCCQIASLFKVSILVLMDVPLQHKGICTKSDCQGWFQSLF